MKVLILGGTRFLGRAIVEAGLKHGHEMTLFNRGNQANVFPDIEQIHGDREGDLSELAGRQWDAVIDTSGLLPWTVEHSAKVLKDSGQYAFVSSCSVYKDHSIINLNEENEVLSLSSTEVENIRQTLSFPEYMEYYGHFKALSERAVEKEMPGRNLSIRAGQIVGPYDYTDRLPYWIKRIAEGGNVLAPGRPERPVQIIATQDMAEWLIRLVEKNTTGIFNAVGPNETLTMERLLNEINTVTKSDAEFTWVNEEFLKEQEVRPWGEMPLWIPEQFPLQGQEKPWKGFLMVDNTKAIEHGLTFRSLSDIIKETFEWEQSRGSYEPKAGMQRERERSILDKWNKRI